MAKPKQSIPSNLEQANTYRADTTNGKPIIPVRLTATKDVDADFEKVWNTIRDSKKNFFNTYVKLVENIFDCNPKNNKITKSYHPNYSGPDNVSQEAEKFVAKNKIPFSSGQAYSLLKYVTEKYVYITLGSYDDHLNWSSTMLPVSDNTNKAYLQSRIDEKFKMFMEDECNSSLTSSYRFPTSVELIWSYWLEEGMLEQTMIAISRRFQNIRNGDRDPLANVALDPLRPLNNLLWGYVQDTQHRLTIQRRAYEYDQHYGLKLIGKAVPNLKSVESRSKFIGAFNNLLVQCSLLYKQVDDLTINPDGFPVLNAIREVHLLLSEGANNQFGDLPVTARIEMLLEQFILSRPEITEFLGGRTMVPYREAWMDKVDVMKSLQGWTSTSISYYFDLADFGESLLLSIRWGHWSEVDDSLIATQWAIHWRHAIQRYIHSYRIVTKVDLSAASTGVRENLNLIPSVLIKREMQNEAINGEYTQ